MATIIHNRTSEPMVDHIDREENWVGTLLVGIVLVILAILFFVYALPALRGAAPATETSTIPSQIDLNLNTPGVTPTTETGANQ